LRIQILGSGGAGTIPQPGCDCAVCVEARAEGLPYSRTGPSVFVHGPDLLIDTPEESKQQLNRAGIERVASCLYSHWHPDHVMGRRVFEMNYGFWPEVERTTDVYVPEQVARDFRERLGTWEHLEFLAECGLIRLHELRDGNDVALGDVRVRPFRLAQDFVYGFLLEQDGRRALVVMDELLGWEPPADLHGVDVAILPMGVTELDPLTGERRIPAEHPLLRTEATHEQTLEIVRRLGAGRVVLSHVEAVFGLSYDELVAVEQQLSDDLDVDVEFAFDSMVIAV
jgi:phosphoribosyl 1,2-cyclic phosphate phosphodiesterase